MAKKESAIIWKKENGEYMITMPFTTFLNINNIMVKETNSAPNSQEQMGKGVEVNTALSERPNKLTSLTTNSEQKPSHTPDSFHKNCEPDKKKLMLIFGKSVKDRTQEEHLYAIKERFGGSVRDYLLSMGEFKDVSIEDKNCEHVWEKFCDREGCINEMCSHRGRLCRDCGIDRLDYYNNKQNIENFDDGLTQVAPEGQFKALPNDFKRKQKGCGKNIRFWHNKECNLDCGTPNPYNGGYYLCEDCENKENKQKGCGKYVGLAFDTNNVKVYCGDEIYGGESRGMFIKLCDKCKESVTEEK